MTPPLTRRWALEPLTCAVHLLLDGEHSSGGLRARCGQCLPRTVICCDQPPPGHPCEDCGRVFLAVFAATPRPAPG